MKHASLRFTQRTGWLVALLGLLALSWIFFHRQISQPLTVHLLLNSNRPRDELFAELAGQSGNPVDFLNRCWATGKAAHRRLVAAYLHDNAATHARWLARAEPLLLAGATDADASVRELALATLETQGSPNLFESAAAQLDDVDPMLRLLGLEYSRKADPHVALPVLMRILDDPDLRVVATTEVGLARWSGEDYGVRTRLALPEHEGPHSGQVDPANVEMIRRSVERRKEWWRAHKNEYSSVPGRAALASFDRGVRRPAPDFTLHDLHGKRVSLSEFKGKVVLLNFWATWCTACLAEIPDLIALQNKLGQEVAILGVALDGVSDEHGDIPGEDGDESSPQQGASLKAARAKVERTVKLRQINYPVLLDPENSVGGQYNGGELPTTVLIDAEGRMRRRFIGERSLRVLEAMVAEASNPARSP